MDDPFITPNHKCRYYACLTCTHKPPVGERVGWMEVAAGNYAVCRVSCLPEEIELAYHALYGLWLPDSGCQPADRPTYEIYRQTPDQHPEGHYTMDICLPLR